MFFKKIVLLGHVAISVCDIPGEPIIQILSRFTVNMGSDKKNAA